MTSIVAPAERVDRASSQPELENQEAQNQDLSQDRDNKAPIQVPVTERDNIDTTFRARTTVRKDIELGEGSFGRVFRAIQSNTQRIVAVKQTRSSLRLKRPVLQHEARVLRILCGHPNIPEVYAYGRIKHFEILSMQLLHRSLRDVVKKDGPLGIQSVANIASQMIGALKHVHSHQLIHRDIKPDNIMLQSSEDWKLCLIDYGLTRPLPSSGAAAISTHAVPDPNSDQPAHLIGTLQYASLNAHEKNSQLTFRDDIESLAYSLFWLLRGSLPWSYYSKCGTRIGSIRQVFAQKKRHNGSTLATGLPLEFGQLVDYARSLSLDEKPDYNQWIGRFRQLELESKNDKTVPEPLVSQTPTIPPGSPVQAGQIVLIKLDPSVTADGYTIREGHESSFIPDLTIDGPEWSTEYRPAVVTLVGWDERVRKHCFVAVAISRRPRKKDDTATPVVSITTSGTHISGTAPTICFEPEWPLDDSYLYAFKRPMNTWRVTSSDCDIILDALCPPSDTTFRSQLREDFKSPDPDIRHDARMRGRTEDCNLYVQIQSLAPAHLHDDSIDWFSERAWFDECIKVSRYYNINNGIWWTGAWFPAEYQPEEGEVSDSLSQPYSWTWDPEADRRKSITLETHDEGIEGTEDIPGGLAEIVGLEK